MGVASGGGGALRGGGAWGRGRAAGRGPLSCSWGADRFTAAGSWEEAPLLTSRSLCCSKSRRSGTWWNTCRGCYQSRLTLFLRARDPSARDPHARAPRPPGPPGRGAPSRIPPVDSASPAVRISSTDSASAQGSPHAPAPW